MSSMPVINFNYRDLIGLIGEDIPAEELMERIPMMGADLHDWDPATEEMAVEFFPDRPDLFSVEGAARALRAFLLLERGMKRYPVEDSGIVMVVEDSVKEVRPHTVGAVIRDVEMSDALIRSMMELQEKLHLTIGRKRAKVSIGVHDLDRVKPPFVYRGVDPDSLSFVPLAKEEEMTLREILERHEKGVDYAFILEGKERFPVILDANGDVLSFPPIINGRLTTVTEETRNIFIDVTGTDPKAIKGALNIIATSLVERGGRIESIVLDDGERRVSPQLDATEWRFPVRECNAFLGIELSVEQIVLALQRMGFDAEPEGDAIEVSVPPIRMDVLHPVDLLEDVAVGHGFENFGSTLPRTQTFGSMRPIDRVSDLVRQLMTGLGYFEVTTLMLSSQRDQFERLGRPEVEVVEIQNPITEDHTCIRVGLLPSLLQVLRRNKHRDLPQRLFEIGDVLDFIHRRKNVAGVSVHAKASFTEVKSVVESLLRNMSVEYSIASSDDPLYILGRGATIMVGKEVVGTFGEVSPRVITEFDLGYPICAFEMDLERFLADRAEAMF